jgi:hypothetical protein
MEGSLNKGNKHNAWSCPLFQARPIMTAQHIGTVTMTALHMGTVTMTAQHMNQHNAWSCPLFQVTRIVQSWPKLPSLRSVQRPAQHRRGGRACLLPVREMKEAAVDNITLCLISSLSPPPPPPPRPQGEIERTGWKGEGIEVATGGSAARSLTLHHRFPPDRLAYPVPLST